MIYIAARILSYANINISLQRGLDNEMCMLSFSTALSSDCLARVARLSPLKRDSLTGLGVAVKIAVRQPPWGRFYRLCELVVSCPSVHWGLTRGPQYSIDDLVNFGCWHLGKGVDPKFVYHGSVLATEQEALRY